MCLRDDSHEFAATTKRAQNVARLLLVVPKGAFRLAKDEQEKREAAEAGSTPGKISRKEFEKELAKLQVELVRLQTWVQAKRARVVVVFEGRDTAGKGGVISRITARTSPRVYRHVACLRPPTVRRRKFTSSAISRISLRRARLSCSTAHGTIARGLSE